MFGDDDAVKSHKSRGDAIGNIVLLAFAVIVARLWYLQIYQGKTLHRYSIENRLRKEVVKAPRGMVFSRNNQLLINNIPRFDAIIVPQYLKNKKKSLAKLSRILGMEVSEIERILKKNRGQASYRPVTVKKNISRQEVAVIETENFKMPGVVVRKFISREYTDKNIGGHLLGYISEINQSQLPNYRERDEFNYKLGDFIGQAGLEEKFDLNLRGEDGYQFVEVDAMGRMKRALQASGIFKDIKNKNANPGNNIRLTIDRDLQISAYRALEAKDRVGSVVAVDVHTGEILAMVSRPSYDPSRFSRGISKEYWGSLTADERNPLRDRTVQEHYSPGSTFKVFTAIAALEEGIVDERTEINCPGYFKLGRRKSHCWKKWGHGKVNVYRALGESCDVYFYKIATKLDIDVLAKYAKMFGFSSKTGINLPREITGLIPTKEWKKKRFGEEWQVGETLSCVIGQSYVLTTPLQLALSYAGIANGGKLYRPRLIKEIFSNNGDVKVKTDAQMSAEVPVSQKTLDIVKKGLYEVMYGKKGTARWYKGRGIRMAGKTGTSQVIRFSAEKLFEKCDQKPYKFRHHGIFVSYAPADDPKIAVSVVAEHGCSGSSAGAPVARDVITTYMKKYHPEKHQEIIKEERKEFLRLKRIEDQKKKQEEEAAESPAVTSAE